MTIRSMPSNQNWDDNYDRIFGKKEEPMKVPDLPLMDFYRVGSDWRSSVSGSIDSAPLFTNIYQVKQAYFEGVLMYEIQILHDPQGSVQVEYDLADLREGLEFCSNYGGVYHVGH